MLQLAVDRLTKESVYFTPGASESSVQHFRVQQPKRGGKLEEWLDGDQHGRDEEKDCGSPHRRLSTYKTQKMQRHRSENTIVLSIITVHVLHENQRHKRGTAPDQWHTEVINCAGISVACTLTPIKAIKLLEAKPENIYQNFYFYSRVILLIITLLHYSTCIIWDSGICRQLDFFWNASVQSCHSLGTLAKRSPVMCWGMAGAELSVFFTIGMRRIRVLIAQIRLQQPLLTCSHDCRRGSGSCCVAMKQKSRTANETKVKKIKTFYQHSFPKFAWQCTFCVLKARSRCQEV